MEKRVRAKSKTEAKYSKAIHSSTDNRENS